MGTIHIFYVADKYVACKKEEKKIESKEKIPITRENNSYNPSALLTTETKKEKTHTEHIREPALKYPHKTFRCES